MPACPKCGEDNPDRARFCWSCGSALAETTRTGAEERKVVSILFVDLVGFTARSDRADPEDVRATLRPYHARVKQEIEHFGGTVEKFIGDAVMAVFGAPTAHEDDAERAVRAALKILDAIEDLNEEHRLELAVRAAVATGEAVVSLDARPEQGEGIATGDVVNTAARLQTAAPVGAVVVGDSTFRTTRDVIVYDELEPVSVKGKAEPLPLWRATRPRGRLGVDVERRADVPFVGREHELTLLKDAYTRALRDSSLQLVTMTGEPGVGKTRLIAEFQSFVDAQDELVWWRQGRCLPYGEGITFWALGEIVKAHVGVLESDTPEEAGAKLRTAVDALVEDPADRDWFATRLAPLTGAQTSEQTVSREESFSAWQRFLEAIAAAHPMVLVIEDLHWADDALVEFLDHLVDWSAGVPLVLLIAARPELYERHSGWGGGKRNSVTIALGPLTDEDTARLVASLVGKSVLPAETQSALLERAGGNPLYAEEFVRMLAERGAPAPDTPLPENVQALIAARLDTLPSERKAQLQNAAVLGKVFWAGGVAAIGGVEEREIRKGMRELVRKELVRPARRSSVEGQEEFAFWHVLVRDVAYQQIPRATRAEKHRAAAAWIEGIAGDRAEDHAEILVYHGEQALELTRAAGGDDGELTEPLRKHLARAGDRARRLDARKAFEYYTRALALTPDDHPELGEALAQAGLAAWDTGELADALQLQERALSEYRARSDPLGVGRTLNELAHLNWVRGDMDAADRYLDESIAVLEAEGPSPDLALAYTRVAGRFMLAARPEEVVEPAKRAIELAERFGVDDRALFAWQTLGSAMCDLGDPGGIDVLHDALTRALASPTGRPAVTAYNNLSYSVWLMESAHRALELKREGIEYAKRRAAAALWLRMEEMWILFDLGEWDTVLEIAEELMEWHEDHREARHVAASVPTFRAFVFALRGRSADADDAPAAFVAAAREIRDPQELVPALSAAAVIAHARGDAEAAIAYVEELDAATQTKPDPIRLQYALPILRVCIELDRLDLGERFFDRPAPAGARQEAVSAAGKAVIAEARGDVDEAGRLYVDAVRLLETYDMPFELGHALFGHWRCTGGDESRRRARDNFRRLGAAAPEAAAPAARESTGRAS
jgi:class 3 adenylate cyclase/tetratricopeptide (TPR) repeat protein